MRWPFRSKAAPGQNWEEYAEGVSSRPAPRLRQGSDVDWALVLLVGCLLGIGLVMVFSASISLADNPKYHTTRWFFAQKHLASIGVGLIAAWAASKVPMRIVYRLAPAAMAVAVLLLVLVLVPGVGRKVNGAMRWIALPGLQLQVTEIAKISVLVAAACFAIRSREYMHSLLRVFIPVVALMGVVCGLAALEPDLGAAVVIACIMVGIVFLGGLNLKIIAVIVGVCLACVLAAIWFAPWRVARVLAYLDPWDAVNVQGKAYQLSHSLIAFGRGEWFGVGLGASVEKLSYLPEAHTDFILAVIGEELGFAGVFGVMLLFYLLVRRIFAIGRQAVRLDRPFSALVAQGVGIWIGVQVIINGGVATGLFPTKGLTLPLVSYGGSAILFVMLGLALVWRVDYENKVLMRGGRV
ncbi:MAG: putative lipid II flippase FtsW [Duodenibacillus sp.]|nr:putative lipid II flippase FtsW [Duodenibacillus sp.]